MRQPLLSRLEDRDALSPAMLKWVRLKAVTWKTLKEKEPRGSVFLTSGLSCLRAGRSLGSALAHVRVMEVRYGRSAQVC
jgi:hypothetical protein